ncbi:MAG: hypothetical protein JW751_23655 [Polyangiaceae bacterium]|nr:hypothetical protein [Polyangiaceae bacterium]
MTARPDDWRGAALLALLACIVTGCEPSTGPRTDSQTNWYRVCESDAQCGGLSCVCGVCTRICDADVACSDFSGATCVAADEVGAIALCSGRSPQCDGLCLTRCDAETCSGDQTCVADVCTPRPEPAVHVVVDVAAHHQELLGFGATLAYAEDGIVLHPRRSELYAAMFSDLGLDVLRLRNRYGYTGDDDLTTASEILSAATTSLGREPTVLLTSWSPPVALKANGALECSGDHETCTLARAQDGRYDYAGFAAYWRASLDAYAMVGLVPDYIGIQNNPDYVPLATEPGEGCRFAPTEGPATVYVDGEPVEVEYPGFAEALTAVLGEIADLPQAPMIAAPESSNVLSTIEYAASLDMTEVDAITHHMYDSDPEAVDLDDLGTLGELGQSLGLPIMQTEMEADGFGTALLLHHAVTVEGVSAYIQNVLVGPSPDSGGYAGTMIAFDVEGFALEDPYYALRHYARHTDPGWIRVDALVDDERLLATAWAAPAGEAMTVVLVNSDTVELAVRLDLGAAATMTSAVTRTVFDGVERSAVLGILPEDGVLRVPGHAIVTLALR